MRTAALWEQVGQAATGLNGPLVGPPLCRPFPPFPQVVESNRHDDDRDVDPQSPAVQLSLSAADRPSVVSLRCAPDTLRARLRVRRCSGPRGQALQTLVSIMGTRSWMRRLRP